MAFTKYQKTEHAEVVSPNGHRAVERELHKMDKTSMRDLSDEERASVQRGLDQAKQGDFVDGPDNL